MFLERSIAKIFYFMFNTAYTSKACFWKKNQFIYSVLQPTFTFFTIKIFISGKIFRWFFKSSKILFSLNHGHKNLFLVQQNKYLKLFLDKYKNRLVFLRPILSKRLLYFITKPRTRNVFTNRGVCINTPYLNKVGKVSDYV